MVRIHDISTNEVIDREMNDVEYGEYEARKEIVAAQEAEAVAKTNVRAEILNRLGLTADEVTLLLS
jgi:hypothetical protein